jgi:23S rRNA (pseudouridine1915-N3)-methyltransferase
LKIHLLCIGRLTEPYLKDGCEEFAKRLRHYLPLTIEEYKEHKAGKKPDVRRSLDAEGGRLLERIPEGAYVIVLDESGKAFSSRQLSEKMQQHMLEGRSQWALIIGGPFGLSDVVRQRADLILALSPMTLTHQMARLLLLEQLYRSCTIIRNEPYHH